MKTTKDISITKGIKVSKVFKEVYDSFIRGVVGGILIGSISEKVYIVGGIRMI